MTELNLKLRENIARTHPSIQHFIRSSYAAEKSQPNLLLTEKSNSQREHSDISDSSPQAADDRTKDLQKTLRRFVIAFIKEQPEDIIGYAVEHFKEIQVQRQLQRAHLQENEPDTPDSSSSTADLVDATMLRDDNMNEGSDSIHRIPVHSGVNSPGSDLSSESRIIIAKSDSQRVRLMNSIRGCVIFQNLEPDKLNKIIDAMDQLYVQVGENIINEDEEGDNFYVIETGTYDVFKEGVLINKLNEGTFGEMALLYNTPRTATVSAATAGCLWVIDRETFRTILYKHAIRQQEKFEELVQYTPLLKNMRKYDLMRVLERLHMLEFEKRSQITHAGEDAQGVYFIAEGQCAIYFTPLDDQKEVFIKYLTKGNYFGDVELILNTRVATNTYAATDVKLAFLKVKDFKLCLGNVMDAMIEHLKECDLKDDYIIDKLNKLLKAKADEKFRNSIKY